MVCNTHLFLLYIELFNDDTNEQIESEKRPEDDEEHKIEVHQRLSFFHWLFVFLSTSHVTFIS